MKIAYLVYHDIASNDGVCKKIQGQISAWKKVGHEVLLLCLVRNKAKTTLPALQYEFHNSLKLRVHLFADLLSDLDKISPDLVYFRNDWWSRTFEYIVKHYRTVIELNTLDIAEYKLGFKKNKSVSTLLRCIGNFCLRNRLLQNVDGLVAVTHEIAEHPSIKKFKKPTVCIPNSIDLKSFNTVKKSKDSNRVGLFFMGSPGQPWHGVDFIVQLAQSLPDYDFHIAGIEGENTDNLFWYGYLQRDEYLKILRKCHICIGTLALYRKNMKEASPLKVREYLAYGFPVILGYQDTAFFESYPKWIKCIDTRKSINISELVDFIEGYCDFVVPRENIKHIATESLEERRCEFFSKVLSEGISLIQ